MKRYASHEAELEYYIGIFSRKKLDRLTKGHKLAYKYSLCAIFINIIGANNHTAIQDTNIVYADRIFQMDRKKTDFESGIKYMSAIVDKSLEKCHFRKPYNNELFDKIIFFVRARLDDIKNKRKSLFLASEITPIMDLKSFLGIDSVGDHHWIEFDLHSGLILTVPEAIIYHDFKVCWNDFVDLRQLIKLEKSQIRSIESYFDHRNLPDTRQKLYKSAGLCRILLFLATTFVEAYLYNLFHTIKLSDVNGKENASNVIGMTKIEDEYIVKSVLYRIFPDLKERIDGKFKRYLKLSILRNRYVHASPLIDKSTNISELQPLLNLDDNILVTSIQNAFDFVMAIDQYMPTKLKMLFWWYDKDLNFSKFEKLKLTNENSRYNGMSYG